MCFGLKSMARKTGPIALTLTVFLAVWQSLCWSGSFPQTLLVPPTDVARALLDLTRDGTLTDNLLASARRVFLALTLGGGAGIVFGLFCGTSKTLWLQIGPLFTALRQIPFIALGPLLILGLGIGEHFIVTLLALAAFFPIALATIEGARGVPTRYLEVVSIYRLSPPDRFRYLFLPSVLPAVAAGTRIAFGRCWGLVVAAELFGATSGLGQMMSWAREMFQIDVVMAGAVVAAAIGIVCDALLRAGARRLMPWGTT